MLLRGSSLLFVAILFVAILLVAILFGVTAQTSLAQQPDQSLLTRASDSDRSSRHQEGLHVNPSRRVAIVGATVHRSPTSTPMVETVLIDGSKIVAIGPELELPAGTRTVDASGKHLYAGLIDAYVGHTFELEPEKGTAYWNENVRPQLTVATEFQLSELELENARKAGFTAALVAPDAGIIQGQSSLLMLGDQGQHQSVLAADITQHYRLTVSRRGRSPGYPNSPMGAYALARQAMLDAEWYQQAWQVAGADASVERPERNMALDALGPVSSGSQMAMVETSNELFAMRADRFAREFGLQLVILGSGNEYRRLDEIASLGRTIVLPVNFPKAPDVSSPELANDVTLESLMHWDHAPENPARLADREVNFVFTSKGLDKKNDFLKNVRIAVERGLSTERALNAMTLGVAKLYGVEHLVGTLEKNKIANITVCDGELFGKKTKVVQTWIAGTQFDFDRQPLRNIAGTWEIRARGLRGQNLVVKESNGKLSARISPQEDAGDTSMESDPDASPSDEKVNSDEKKKTGVAIKPFSLNGTRMTGAFKNDEFGHKGTSLFSLVVIDNKSATGQLTLPDGKTVPFSAKLMPESESGDSAEADSESATEVAKMDDAKSDPADDSAETDASKEAVARAVSYPVNYPLGAFGRTSEPEKPKSVLVKNVTIWTLDKKGKIENGAVLFGDGVIRGVFAEGSELPESDVVIDGAGAHLTPGIIDCHSHMATDSGVNESGQAVTAEVRIGDMIDCDDITIYRQLAGGVTSSNILHGSANPIGGQNQVIKLRWGASEQAMKFAGAPEGIKFALGENVKQSNRRTPSTRYPQTRMGVEQIIDDSFRAAIDYQNRWDQWNDKHSGLPPRRDLELEAMAEILAGKRWVHCHSYRQDEILALIRTLDKYDVTIGSFQHILEGYKVADAMAKHGAMGSAFADWWAYKYEVKDAIPYAGALMHRAGVVVSYNSDDGELGRHLNHEAAKAVKYGGVSEVEALKFVTLNPARQLRIDNRVGSIEVGKDADFVLWSGHPLSTMSVVKQTWIDGQKYFDRSDDAKDQVKTKSMRVALIQKVLNSGDEMVKPNRTNIDPARLWPRYDEFCGHSHHHDDDHDHDDDSVFELGGDHDH